MAAFGFTSSLRRSLEGFSGRSLWSTGVSSDPVITPFPQPLKCVSGKYSKEPPCGSGLQGRGDTWMRSLALWSPVTHTLSSSLTAVPPPSLLYAGRLVTALCGHGLSCCGLHGKPVPSCSGLQWHLFQQQFSTLGILKHAQKF